MRSNELVTYKLSDITNIIGGGTPKTNNSKYWNGNIPWLSVVDFAGENKRVYSTEKSITEKGLQESSTKILKKGQLIISARGTVGEIAMLGNDMAFNQSCYGLDAKPQTTNNYLYYLLKHHLEEIKRKTHGAVFDTITKETFNHISVVLPPLPVQNQIADILSSLDDKIELNCQKNQTLKAIVQAIFKEWFVDFNFPNSTGKMQTSELGEIPVGWQVGKLSDIISNFDSKRIPLSSMEREKRKGIYPYYGAAAIVDYVNDFLFDGVYVLMGEDGTVITKDEKPVLQYVNGKFWVNNHTHVLRGKNHFTTEYIYLVLANTNIKHIVTGAVQPKINQGNMNNLKIILPEKMITERFCEKVQPLFNSILLNEEENKTLIQLRNTLLPKLMNGEIPIHQI